MKWLIAGLLAVLLLGSQASAQPSPQITQCVTNAIAGGTGDAITVPLLPCGLATNILLLTITSSNSTTTPTLQMPGFPALPIKLASGSNVGVGALSAGSVVQLTSTGTSWLLLTSPTGNIANLNIGTGLTSSLGTLTLATQGCSGGQVVNGINLGNLTCTSVTVPGTLINPANYGVICDGVTNTLTPLDTMLTTIPSGSVVLMPPTICKVLGTVTITQPVTLWFPNGGGISQGIDGINTIYVSSSNVKIMGSNGATINGTRTPGTGNDYVAGSYGILVLGTSGNHLTNISISGMNFTNSKDTSVWIQYANNVLLNGNVMGSQSYAGILCESCLNVGVVNNIISGVSSSNGPASSVPPAGTKTNAYGITFTVDGAENFSRDSWIIGNTVSNVPTWECYDTHGGFRIHFIGNICNSARVGVQITTTGGVNAAQDTEVIGNTIFCTQLGSAIYPGGPGISVGGPGIYVAGVSGGALGTDNRIIGNVVNGCGSSENATPGAMGAIEVGDQQSFEASSNHLTSNRYRGFLTYGTVLGKITGNTFNSQVAGPLASGNILIDTESTTTQLLLSQNWANSPGSDGYCVPASIGGTVGVARDNTFFALANLYNGSCGGNANRTDLGATAP